MVFMSGLPAAFRVTYAQYAELREDIAEQMARGGLLVKVHDTPGLDFDSSVALELVLPDGTTLQSSSRVLQIFAGFGVAVTIEADLVEQASRHASRPEIMASGTARHERVEVAVASKPAPRQWPSSPSARRVRPGTTPVPVAGAARSRDITPPGFLRAAESRSAGIDPLSSVTSLFPPGHAPNAAPPARSRPDFAPLFPPTPDPAPAPSHAPRSTRSRPDTRPQPNLAPSYAAPLYQSRPDVALPPVAARSAAEIAPPPALGTAPPRSASDTRPPPPVHAAPRPASELHPPPPGSSRAASASEISPPSFGVAPVARPALNGQEPDIAPPQFSPVPTRAPGEITMPFASPMSGAPGSDPDVAPRSRRPGSEPGPAARSGRAGSESEVTAARLRAVADADAMARSRRAGSESEATTSRMRAVSPADAAAPSPPRSQLEIATPAPASGLAPSQPIVSLTYSVTRAQADAVVAPPEPEPPAEPPALGSGAFAKPDGLTRMEKVQKALHGTREERNAILRDRDRTLHPFVLKNPQLDADDVVGIAKNPQMTSEMLKQLGDRRDWFQRPAVALALARNPRTPPELAVRALDHVPVEALRQIAKGTGVLPHVSQAARRKLLG